MPYREYFVPAMDGRLALESRFRDVEFAVYLAMVFLAPFFLGHLWQGILDQFVVGSIVNCFLALGALYLGMKKVLPLILLPSIAAFLTGIVFGPQSLFLLYLIPFIWVGNAIFVYAIKLLKVARGSNYALSLAWAAAGKSLFLLIASFALFSLSIIPVQFLFAMGLLQFATALTGGAMAGTIYILRR